MKSYIEFKKVNKEYKLGKNRFLAVNNIDFTIGKGEFVVVLGPSGAGKSTVLNLLGGMDTVTSGTILVDGKDITSCSDRELTDYRATDVGFIFQFYNLIPSLTVRENVALVKEIVKSTLDVESVLESVGLNDHRFQFPTQLSGGEQQRVSIARAIFKNPKLLLCDEPTGALDSDTGVVILSLLQDMSRIEGRTVIIVTHNAILAEAADKVIKLKNGKVQEVIFNNNPIPVNEVNW
ncbi:ATP-binding cassette domain-containing protein [Alkalibaculum sp. M08DMB]|uniref:ATP-binding cassette domain-containing protein n=1 Tax=Alkalibaculum sporogenes TaxID=2655001 RepID=A0A6A7KAB4_9FIRM|nr:ABC transporter ATP-binding protein [Alkalibaculum sporogenes]MPW26489.1 ATP-binding cassette domain-containing protein [Alkalibaculum sporogenes]